MNTSDIIRETAKRLDSQCINVEVNSSFGWVTISAWGEEDIFLQNDEGYDFADEADKLWNNCGDVYMHEVLLHLAEPYTDLWT